MIKAVIFDFGQTLVDSANGFRKAEKDAQAKIFSNLSLTLQEDFLKNYRRFRKELHEQSIFSRMTLWKEVYLYYSQEPDLCLLETWEKEYWMMVRAHTTLFPKAEPVLKSLSAIYRVALITNTQGQQGYGTHRMNMFPELEPYFELVIVAGEGGVPPKPHPEPFHLCLKNLHVLPAESVYVGDDWRIDICGARDAGLTPIWLKHEGIKRSWPDIKTSIPIVHRLDQLLDLETLLGKK
ncbi:MAG TPA: HAD family hydrolase [Desulfobacterales bacterium]|nr:HAD family hydrolase [Desulfobacterales bacterium]